MKLMKEQQETLVASIQQREVSVTLDLEMKKEVYHELLLEYAKDVCR